MYNTAQAVLVVQNMAIVSTVLQPRPKAVLVVQNMAVVSTVLQPRPTPNNFSLLSFRHPQVELSYTSQASKPSGCSAAKNKRFKIADWAIKIGFTLIAVLR